MDHIQNYYVDSRYFQSIQRASSVFTQNVIADEIRSFYQNIHQIHQSHNFTVKTIFFQAGTTVAVVKLSKSSR